MDPGDSALDSAGDTRNELAPMDAGRLLCKRHCLDSATGRGAKCLTWWRVVANHIPSGPNFYIGNNLEANGIYVPLVPGHGTPMYERADAERLAEQAVGHELSAREVSQFWMSRAWEEIRQSPSRWLQLMLAKTFMVFNRYEVPDVESMYIFREYSVPLKLSRIWHFGTLCPLAIWGLIATWGDWRKLWLYYLLLLTMIAAVVLFFILGRYRNPVAILFVPFAAAGVVDLCAGRRTKMAICHRRRGVPIAIRYLLQHSRSRRTVPPGQLLHEYGNFGLQGGQPPRWNPVAAKCNCRVSRNGRGVRQSWPGVHVESTARSGSKKFSIRSDPRSTPCGSTLPAWRGTRDFG